MWMCNALDPEGDFCEHPLPDPAMEIRCVSFGHETVSVVSEEGEVFITKLCVKEGSVKDVDWKHPLRSIQPEPLVSQVASGKSHHIAMTTNNKVLTWGNNNHDQMGRPIKKSKKAKKENKKINFCNPGMVLDLQHIIVVQVTCGASHSLCLTKGGHVYSWGANDCGQLGVRHGTSTGPQLVDDLSNSSIVQIFTGATHCFALSSSGCVYGWGSNSHGQLGIELKGTSHFTPVKCLSMSSMNVKVICCGENHSAFLTQDGRVFTCGQGTLGQLGYNSPDDVFSPQHIPDVGNVSQIACGRNFTLAWIQSSKLLHIYGSGKRIVTLPIQEGIPVLVCGKEFFCIYQSTKDQENQIKSQQLTLDSIQDALNNATDSNNITTSSMSPVTNLWVSHLDQRHLDIIICAPSDVKSMSMEADTLSLVTKEGKTYTAKLKDKETGRLLKNISIDHFQSYVEFFMSCVTAAMTRLKQTESDSKLAKEKTIIESCVAVLDMLNEINQLRCSPISFELFHMNELMDRINVNKDLIRRIEDIASKNPQIFRFCKYPFFYNSAAKCLVLKIQCREIMALHKKTYLELLHFPKYYQLSINREKPVECTKILLDREQAILRRQLDVVFEREMNDSGVGIRQEFFEIVLKKLFHTDFKAFHFEEKDSLLWFAKGANLKDLELVGLICGLALYNGALIPTKLPLALYKKLLKRPVTFEDLCDLHPSCSRPKEMILYEKDDFEERFPDCAFSDAVHHPTTRKIQSVDLCEGGKDITVTQNNKLDYVDKLVDYHLNTSIQKEFDSFCEGFYKSIPENLVSSFHSKELKHILEGDEAFDFIAVEKAMKYKGEYNKDHTTIRLFWKVFHGMDLKLKQNLMKFLTGCDRIPADGIEQMEISIKPKIEPEVDADSLIIKTYTCTRELFLPVYRSRQAMKKNILRAAKNPTTFTLGY